jgi:putative transposase
MDYRYGSHTVFNIEYHFVWVTKYRYKVLKGDVALRVRELVRQTCEAFEIRIISGVVSKDHVHIFVSAPPTMAPSEIMRRIKGRSAAKLFEEFPGFSGSPMRKSAAFPNGFRGSGRVVIRKKTFWNS